MKKFLSLLIVSLFSLSLLAETYTIVFNSSESDATNTPQVLESFVLSATNNCVSELLHSEKINRAKEGYGIKGGTGTAKGELTLGLDDTYHITTMTVYTACFGTDSTKNYGLFVCGQKIQWTTGYKTVILPYTITLNADLDSITIAAENAKNNRWYVYKIEFEAVNPHPTKAIIEMQYATLNLGAVSWVSEDEPMEDAIGFEIEGKNITSEIALRLKSKSSKFVLTPDTLPATGGEASVSYSITMSDAPSNAITYKDTVIVSATGTDAIEQTRKLPIELTIKPKPSGTTTIDLDTTRMAIGPMPGNYYEFAQNTTDSTLKNHLGYIICCGKRYKYGSGMRKTWDAFFYTDRDTNTNRVLDMYSDSIRYFNPEKPTASVSGFDIEHMLPKSWWGGDVNPAYCDLFHLVPGDYSANRSKSNHAPGIPSDSTFNNGSFVTGSGAAYGLVRVFCPADEYKGDFARAYFYIACCYGDSLTWVAKGEPGIAMTNEGWQEFRPWLRDLLLSWHRLDPVSQKELDRAIEVNKIQGNRNPFIDYPELAEYIWGNKQGQSVDFRTLDQSYGDQYDDGSASGVSNPTAQPAAVKELRNGQIVIIRNTTIYTTLGQTIR